jgi:4-hydroxythreonine-4-phosphate dehydrogenase
MTASPPVIPAPVIALCSGEPAGIGPDICAMLAMRDLPLRLAVLGDPTVLGARARELGLPVNLTVHDRLDQIRPQRSGMLEVLGIEAGRPVIPGRLDPGNADYVLRILRHAVELCLADECAAIVTAPVQKSVINEAGVPFSGHTGFLAELTGADHSVMMLADETLRVALATTHCARLLHRM